MCVFYRVSQTNFHKVFSFQSVNQQLDVVVKTKVRRPQLQPVDLMLVKTACCDTMALVYVPRTVIDTVQGPVKCALQCMEDHAVAPSESCCSASPKLVKSQNLSVFECLLALMSFLCRCPGQR